MSEIHGAIGMLQGAAAPRGKFFPDRTPDKFVGATALLRGDFEKLFSDAGRRTESVAVIMNL